ncbi:FCP1 [Enterospora canceri]|uniref:protein-serine/threonine phosphatase n=1 Tax=Enterospora canceri TaxID=1081671 RepID=A0A1Y1S571_9MICR|nr:FCP1 [Enterospora canceri]
MDDPGGNPKRTKKTAALDDLEKEIDFELDMQDEKCSHALRMGDLCANCGTCLERDVNLVTVTHGSDQLLQRYEDAFRSHLKHFYKLAEHRKLILLCDLDQTVIHATLEKANCDFSFELDGVRFAVKNRRWLDQFLRKTNRLFEMHVYTLGTRGYADAVCKAIDPDKTYFGDRIVTRTENNNELKKYIKRITSFDQNVLVLDDRIDVWGFIPNCIFIRPFCYYSMEDVNDPVRLAKMRLAAKKENFLDAAIQRLLDEEAQSNQDRAADEYRSMVKEDVNVEIEEESEGEEDIFDISNKPNKEDMELKKVYLILKKLHKGYFRKLDRIRKNERVEDIPVEQLINVGDVAQIRALKRYSVVCRSKYRNYVLYLGGRIIKIADLEHEDKSRILVINDRAVASKYGIRNMSEDLLTACLYNRCFVTRDT